VDLQDKTGFKGLTRNLFGRFDKRPMTRIQRITATGLVVTAATCATLLGVRTALQVPDASLETLAETKSGITIYDRYNREICTVQTRDREPVPLEKMSVNMRNAVVAVEDHNFYKHHGLDPVGIARAAYVNWKAGSTVEGASTLTQQLARNLFLDKDDRSYVRKIREAFVAWDLENRYSKTKILESYLNEVYFGGGAHGIQRAAEHYFNKPASQLSVGEAAFLAGLLKSPTTLAAPGNEGLAIARRNEVLDKMARNGYITSADAEREKQTKLVFVEGPHKLHYPHYVAFVLDQLEKELGSQMWTRGYKVYTHLDPKAQQLAEKALNNGIKNAPHGIDQGALVSMSLRDGGIVAMVGGVGRYSGNEWNRAVAPHTAGSSFKPFVYLAALIDGTLAQDSLVADVPFKLESTGMPVWEPKNFDGRFLGWLSVRDALCMSRNVCAIRVGQAVGLDRVIETARTAGVRAQMDAYPSLALGSCAVTPLDMAASYGTLARYGTYMQPQAIREIDTEDGVKLREFVSTPSSNLPSQNCAQLVDAMQDVVQRGTGTAARLPGVAVAGKTGTADKGKDLWFVGFTPETVTAVWGGNDKNKPVRGTHATGGTVMARIWRDYMAPYTQMHKPVVTAFAPPAEPLMRGIPVFGDSELASGMDYAGLVSAQAKPTTVVARLDSKQAAEALSYPELNKVATETGIISAVGLQRYVASYRNQLAQANAQQIGAYGDPGQYGVQPTYGLQPTYSMQPAYGAQQQPTYATTQPVSGAQQSYNSALPQYGAQQPANPSYGAVSTTRGMSIRERTRTIEVPVASSPVSPSAGTIWTAPEIPVAAAPEREPHM
jgi:penicillin-binding protein 1A